MVNEHLPRVTLRMLLWMAGIAFAVHLFLPQLGELRQTSETVRQAQVGWLLLGVAGVAANYVAAAVCQLGAVDRSLPLGAWLSCRSRLRSPHG